MRNPSAVRFPLVALPDEILPKLIEGFRRSETEICASLVRQLSLEARRRASHGFATVEIVLPLVTSPQDAFDFKVVLFASAAELLERADAETNTLESPSPYQVGAEFMMAIVHSIERQERTFQFSAASSAN